MTACEKCGHDPAATVVAYYTFLVDRDPPSLNARLFNTGTRAHLYRKERDAWCWEFRAVRLLQRIPPVGSRAEVELGNHVRKRRVTLTRVYGGRQKERDGDNLAGGMKACVDALVFEGLLKNDDPSSAEIHYAQTQGTPTGLRVEIEVLA